MSGKTTQILVGLRRINKFPVNTLLFFQFFNFSSFSSEAKPTITSKEGALNISP